MVLDTLTEYPLSSVLSNGFLCKFCTRNTGSYLFSIENCQSKYVYLCCPFGLRIANLSIFLLSFDSSCMWLAATMGYSSNGEFFKTSTIPSNSQSKDHLELARVNNSREGECLTVYRPV